LFFKEIATNNDLEKTLLKKAKELRLILNIVYKDIFK
jgi:hypothetical protein